MNGMAFSPAAAISEITRLRAEVARLTQERENDKGIVCAELTNRDDLVAQLVGALRDALMACEIMFRGVPGLSPETRAAAEHSMLPARAALAAAEAAGIR